MEQINLPMTNDVFWGQADADVVDGGIGEDVIFGGDGADVIDGGPGRDVIVAGNGDDTIILDADCAAVTGEVVDGGDGFDVVKSHLTQVELQALGVVLASIESYVLIPDATGGTVCGPYPVLGPVRPPRLAMSWPAIPDPSSSSWQTSSIVPLVLTNDSADGLSVTLTATLRVGGGSAEQVLGPFTIGPQGTTTASIDVMAFVPSWVDPQSIPPEVLDLPISALLTVHADVTVGQQMVETPSAPRIYGHLEDQGDTLVLYGSGAYRYVYRSGDLRLYQQLGPGESPSNRGISHVHG